MASAPLTQPKPKLAARPRHVPLGQLLVEAGVLSEDQLARALAEQKRTQAPLGGRHSLIRTAGPASLPGGSSC